MVQARYLPYGQERWISGTLTTDFTYTGQQAERGFGLMDYNAQDYDPYHLTQRIRSLVWLWIDRGGKEKDE